MPGTIPVFFIMLGVVVWSVTYALELMIDDMSSKILFMKLQYLGITTIPTMWLSSVLQHTGLNKRLSKRYRIPLLSIMPVITLVLVFTNEYHGLIWKEITLNVDGPFPLTNLAHGKWFWTYLSYSHLMLLFSTILIINAVIHSLETYRKHGITILIGTFAPWIGNALYISGLTPHHIDLSPFAFSLTGIAAAWGMSHFHLFDILPVARDMVIKSMNNPVIVLDMEDNIIYINPAARDIIRSPSISPIGQSITDIPQFQSTSLRQYLEKTEVYTEISMDIAVEKRYFELQVQPLINKFENQIGRFFVLRDITERKKAEEELKIYQEHLEEMVKERTTELKDINDQLQREVIERKRMEEELIKAEKLEAVSVLAGGIAHDFNNILTAILGNVSLAKLYIDSENKAFDRLTDTEKAVDRAVELTKKLITFASGGAPVVKPVSIKELLIETANFCLQGSNVKCVLSIPDDIWQVEIDEGQIGQVISNIVINARQSMPNGGTINLYAENIVLEEDIETLLKNERFVRISIQDQGTGISNDILNRIFEPYFTTKEGGAGLGLAISYSIIKKHGGNITVESYQGIGTTFHIYLPVFAKEIPEAVSYTHLTLPTIYSV